MYTISNQPDDEHPPEYIEQVDDLYAYEEEASKLRGSYRKKRERAFKTCSTRLTSNSRFCVFGEEMIDLKCSLDVRESGARLGFAHGSTMGVYEFLVKY